jgi:hypothetical protein
LKHSEAKQNKKWNVRVNKDFDERQASISDSRKGKHHD